MDSTKCLLLLLALSGWAFMAGCTPKGGANIEQPPPSPDPSPETGSRNIDDGPDLPAVDRVGDAEERGSGDALDVLRPGDGPFECEGDSLADFEVGEPADWQTDGLPDSGPEVDSDGDGLPDAQEQALGTDPFVADSDTDGIADGAEVAAGTDPRDPASASSWQPQWSGHPRLLFGPADLDAIRQRTRLASEPFATLIARVRNAAAETPSEEPVGDYNPEIAFWRARVAKSAAFLALVEDDAGMAAKAAGLVRAIHADVEWVTWDHPQFNHTDILVAEAIASYALALDWLLATPFADEDRTELEAALVRLVSHFETACAQGSLGLMLLFAQNNHNIKSWAAIGLSGLLFNHRPEAARWVSRGMTSVLFYLTRYQTTPDGGYAEGPAYLNYGAGEFFPLLWAYHRFSQGQTLQFRNFYETRPRAAGDPEFSLVADPSCDPVLRELFLWPLRISMPGGNMPNLDDSGLSGWMGAPYAALLYAEPSLFWFWSLPDTHWESNGGSDASSDLLAILPDPLPAATPPQDWDVVLVQAGQAVLRSGWQSDAFWTLLLGEQGTAWSHGQGHEHGDANSFLLAAHGEYLLIDSGYVNWDEREWVAKPENHNLILVDGQGPPRDPLTTRAGSDTVLSDFAVTPEFKTVVSTAQYAGVVTSRRLVWFADEWLLIHDRVQADAAHTYDWLLHGLGGGDSGGEFQQTETGARWTRAAAGVHVAVTSSADGLTCYGEPMPHSFYYGQLATHSRLRCQAEADSVQFLSVVQVEAGLGQPVPDEPVVAGLSPARSVVFVRAGIRHVVLSLDKPLEAVLATPCGAIDTDAALVLVRCAALSEQEPDVRFWDGTFAEVVSE